MIMPKLWDSNFADVLHNFVTQSLQFAADFIQCTMSMPDVENTGTMFGLSVSLKDVRLLDDKQQRIRKHKTSNSRKLSADDVRKLFNVFYKFLFYSKPPSYLNSRLLENCWPCLAGLAKVEMTNTCQQENCLIMCLTGLKGKRLIFQRW